MHVEVVSSRLDIEKSGSVAEKRQETQNQQLASVRQWGKNRSIARWLPKVHILNCYVKYAKLKMVKSRVLG